MTPGRMGRRAAHTAGGLLLAGLLAGCAGGGKEATNDLDRAPPKTTTLQVRAVTAQTGTLTAQRSASATIEAGRDSQVAAQSGGTVEEILVPEGERVARGDVVVRLDDTAQRQALENARLQLRQAQISLDQTQNSAAQATTSLQAAVTSSEAALAQARQNAQSAETLYGLGGVSLADLQAARSQLAQAESQLAQARNQLAQNGRSAQSSVPLGRVQVETAEASVQQAQTNLSRTRVRAPFAGTVADISVEVGEFAAQGSPVFRLVDPGTIRVKFNVPSADAAALTEGAKFNVGYGGKNYVGTVVDSSGIAGSNRLVPVTARVEGGSALPIGGAARASYRVRLGNGLLIPNTALQVEGGESAVYTVSQGRAQRQVVSVVAESGSRIAVSGIEAGARVIDPLPASLQDGARVEVRP
ncbi:efflux RND transporter periplasmic adaptor subunit [Deinococcus reticulitermitis]|nr:efflux RND transporter periplasmic adaptor subunit [Deinococcus reticulitermitis]